LVPEFNPVARKEVREEQYCHALWKLVPAVSGIAGMVARAVQLLHDSRKMVPESNPVARKEVREVLLLHA
tara:strand:- start:517 stop:726 length:210 start_codon:yes stop_codon:yes gene_type:complete